MENQLRKITFKKIEYYLYNYDYIDIRIDNIRMDINSLDYNQNYTKLKNFIKKYWHYRKKNL